MVAQIALLCSFFTFFILFTFIVVFLLGGNIFFPNPTSYVHRHKSDCGPSACGNIQNISYPFRLRADPKRCGDSSYELVCENNTAFLYDDDSHKYRVQAINYHNYTIRLADAAINENDSCSFPLYSQNDLIKVNNDYPYSILTYDTDPLAEENDRNHHQLAFPITFLSCQYPINNPNFHGKAYYCGKRDDASNASLASNKSNTYMAWYLDGSDLGDMCRIDGVVLVSSFPPYHNLSISQLHGFLLYGFEISWYNVYCDNMCRLGESCLLFKNRLICHPRNYDAKCYDNEFRNISSDMKCNGVRDLGIFFNVKRYRFWYILVSIGDWIVIGINLAAKIIFGVPFVMGLIIYKYRTRHLSMYDAIEGFLQHEKNLAMIRYSYSDIKKITRGFREKLGQGGYGSVYKGKLRSGSDVAVKLLTKSRENGKDFMNEMSTIGRIHHVNVVKLVGYCAERSKRALVYDFMPHGSLEKYIQSEETSNSLSWNMKYDIAVGVARGIQYLHQGCDIQILHFDIKPHNILLDDHFTPKISDFGLAKFYSINHNTVTLTAARGTIGYVAPELIYRSIGNPSYKADVYSFGMLLMGIVGLNRNSVANADDSSQYFPYCIYSYLDKWKDVEMGNGDEIASHGDDNDEKITRKMAIVALWCIQMSPGDRPSMSRVLEMLGSEVELLQIPPQPSYAPHQQFVQSEGTYTSDSITLLCDDNNSSKHKYI